MADPGTHAPPIAAHRLLGDGHSAALVRPDGEIDWWCAPRFDSPPLLWSLLDAGGAAARWCDARMADSSGPVAGPVLGTVLRVGRGRVETLDGLVGSNGDGTTLVRLARGIDEDLVLDHDLTLGGFDQDWAEWSPGQAAVGGQTLVVVGGETSDAGGGRHLTRLLAPKGEWAGLMVSFDPDRRFDIAAILCELDDARRRVDELDERSWVPHHHKQRVIDALDVIRTSTYAPTGAVVAAVTTSLPEAPGYDRQFDYRFTWLRDASLAVSVAALLGHRQMSHRHLRFVASQSGDSAIPRGPMTTVSGGEVPEERSITGVDGWAGSLPVRVGNAARDQVQYDALGMFVESVSVHVQMGGALEDDVWELVKAVADHMCIESDDATHGIWELREPRRLVCADIGRFLALDRAIRMARWIKPFTSRRQWKKGRRGAQERVLAAIGPNGELPQSYDDDPPVADASSLLAVLFRLIPSDDPRAHAVVDSVVAALEAQPYLYRYEPGSHDGFEGIEGAFVPCSWWLVGALANLGRLDEARARADALDEALPRLLPEEVDPASHVGLGNVPLVWSHMEAARALYLLHAAEVRDRWGTLGLGVWRVGRYIANRRRD